MEREKFYEKILKGEELSFEDRLEVISGLVSDKVFETIMENIVLAKATGEELSFRVSRDGIGSDEVNIGRVLKLLGANVGNIESKEVSSNDMMGYSENYVNTDITLSM